MLDEIRQIREKAIDEILKTSDLILLENLERKFVGRNGQLRDLILKLKNLKEEERKKMGQLLNDAKKDIENLIQEKKRFMVYGLESRVEKFFDVTLPGEKFFYGHLHPSTQLKNEVSDIFSSLGFEILEGQEVDNEYYNFETLNIHADHPARDMWDTFYIRKNDKPETINNKLKSLGSKVHGLESGDLLLRAHTSNMQVRVMEKRKPPLKVCVIGKCFRHEATNATHEHTLYQIEGFVVDEKITLANLIYTLKTFLAALYNKEVKIRVRPAYFPFVEPGLEVDMGCLNCGGTGYASQTHANPALAGQTNADSQRQSASSPRKSAIDTNRSECLCQVCKGSGWIEILGAGMIHPKVFEYAGYLPCRSSKGEKAGPKNKYTGFAFGVGLDRLVMMKYKIDDIRRLHAGDLRFIKQF